MGNNGLKPTKDEEGAEVRWMAVALFSEELLRPPLGVTASSSSGRDEKKLKSGVDKSSRLL
jgi:hypothetical protein